MEGSFLGRGWRPLVALAAGIVAAGCSHTDLPAPVLGAPPPDDGCVAIYPLTDAVEDDREGLTAVACHGRTASTNSWGSGARFHLTLYFDNQTGETVRFAPADARLRDLGKVEIRQLEVRAADGDSPLEIEIADGERTEVDVLFGAPALRGPARWERFDVHWTYRVGETEVHRAAVFEKADGEPLGGMGPWEWAPGEDAGDGPRRTLRWERAPTDRTIPQPHDP